MSQIKHDLDAVAKEMGNALIGQFNDILDKGIGDLEGPIRAISMRMALAARHQNPELVQACKDQLALILQEHEVELKATAGGGVLDFIVNNGVTLLVNGAVAGLTGLRVTP